MLIIRSAGLVLAISLAEPCSAVETVYFKNGRSLVVEGHQSTGSRTALVLKGNGQMEVESEWIQEFGPTEETQTPAQISKDLLIPNPPTSYSLEELQQLVRESARKFDLDEKLLISMIRAESNFDPLAVSNRGAQGLMQLMPETALAYKVKDPFNPRENLEAGAKYLKDLLLQFNQNLVLALAAYNAGPTSVASFSGIPPFPETNRYVRKVLALKEESQ